MSLNSHIMYTVTLTVSGINSYTVFASKWQVQFFKHQPQEVMSLLCKLLTIHVKSHNDMFYACMCMHIHTCS